MPSRGPGLPDVVELLLLLLLLLAALVLPGLDAEDALLPELELEALGLDDDVELPDPDEP